jgi:ankyrin repeat protein
MRAYFNEVRHAVREGILKSGQYCNLLVQPNTAGFTPLHEALISGNPDNMRAYFDEVRNAVREGILKVDDYHKLLVAPNRAGFTPLHQVASNGTPNDVRFFLEKLETSLNRSDFAKALHQKTKNEYLPSAPRNNRDAAAINALLNTARREHPLNS